MIVDCLTSAMRWPRSTRVSEWSRTLNFLGFLSFRAFWPALGRTPEFVQRVLERVRKWDDRRLPQKRVQCADRAPERIVRNGIPSRRLGHPKGRPRRLARAPSVFEMRAKD